MQECPPISLTFRLLVPPSHFIMKRVFKWRHDLHFHEKKGFKNTNCEKFIVLVFTQYYLYEKKDVRCVKSGGGGKVRG